MSYYTREQALEMVLQDDLDSGGEIDIEEDPDFPLPHSIVMILGTIQILGGLPLILILETPITLTVIWIMVS